MSCTAGMATKLCFALWKYADFLHLSCNVDPWSMHLYSNVHSCACKCCHCMSRQQWPSFHSSLSRVALCARTGCASIIKSPDQALLVGLTSLQNTLGEVIMIDRIWEYLQPPYETAHCVPSIMLTRQPQSGKQVDMEDAMIQPLHEVNRVPACIQTLDGTLSSTDGTNQATSIPWGACMFDMNIHVG